jgi:hypothetical protein
MEIPELLEKGFERIKQELVDKATLGLEQCKSMITNSDTYVRKALNDDSVNVDMSLSGNTTIYNV